MSSVDDLVTWLRAQLDDDERVAREAVQWSEGAAEWANPGEPDWEHIARHGPARVLAEVDAKRRLLDYLVALEDKALDGNWWNLDTDEPAKLLALPYADRPGYRDEWNPCPARPLDV